MLWLCGPRAVGKSCVGYEIFLQVQREGRLGAYVDLAQVGFVRPAAADDPDNHRIKATNLAVMWPTFRAAGARYLIVTGAVRDRATVDRYTAAVPDAALTLCRLRVGRDGQTERILDRGRGGGPPIPGDELVGRPVAELRRLAGRVADEAAELDRAGLGETCVDTDGLTVAQAARLVRERAGGWPPLDLSG
jgi:hypothetical protein